MEVYIVVKTYAWHNGPESSDENYPPYGHVVSVHLSRKKANKEVQRLDRLARRRHGDYDVEYEFWHSVVKMAAVP